MEYVNFGNTGVKVSPIALGLGLREQASAEEAERLINHAIDSGINFIDCANRYALANQMDANQGSAEKVLGRVLRTRRDEVVITTKVQSTLGPIPNSGGASRLHILREMENSLRRLNTDHVDIYLLHHYDTETSLDETIRALDDLVTQGKTRYVGCCNYAAWQVCKSLWIADHMGADPFIATQNSYSLLNRQPEMELFGLVQDQGLGMMAYSPLAAGLLSGDYTPGEDPPEGSLWDKNPRGTAVALPIKAKPLFDSLHNIASEYSKTFAQVAMNWVLSHPEITVAITGSDTIERFDENLGAVGWALGEKELKILDAASAFKMGN